MIKGVGSQIDPSIAAALIDLEFLLAAFVRQRDGNIMAIHTGLWRGPTEDHLIETSLGKCRRDSDRATPVSRLLVDAQLQHRSTRHLVRTQLFGLAVKIIRHGGVVIFDENGAFRIGLGVGLRNQVKY